MLGNLPVQNCKNANKGIFRSFTPDYRTRAIKMKNMLQAFEESSKFNEVNKSRESRRGSVNMKKKKEKRSISPTINRLK